MSTLGPTLQAFFTDRLIAQRHASPHTIAAYRDTLRLLLGFAEQRLGRQACKLDIADLDAKLIGAFLDHLEHDRDNSVRTRNARLAAIHSLFRYATLRHPEHAALIERVLAIPPKRTDRALISFPDEHEVDALLASPNRTTWTGRRDHALLLLALQTGLRASELTGLSCADVHLGTGAHVSCLGKGRKQRITPLTRDTVAVLRTWARERAGQPDDPLFPTSRGRTLSRDALERRLAKHTANAVGASPSLANKKVTLHVLRHTAAMRLLHAGVDTSVIALWLGHERVDTTHIYLHADLALKERALARTTPQQRPRPIPAPRRHPRLPRQPLTLPTRTPKRRSRPRLQAACRDDPELGVVAPAHLGYGGGMTTAADVSHWLARGARTEAEAAAAQRMRDLMGTISEGAYEAAWCQNLPDLLRPAVERLLAGQEPELAVGNPLAAGATEVPDALGKLAEIAGRHRIWLRETDDPWDPLRVVPEAF